MDKKNTVHASIAPWLSVRNAENAAKFYKSAFNASELYRLEEDNGKLAIAQLAIGEADFWLQEDPDADPFEVENGPVRMIITVEDPDSMIKQALSAGAEEIYPVSEGHGWRIGRIADPFGHHWEIGRRLD